jgi:hypothetical protein
VKGVAILLHSIAWDSDSTSLPSDPQMYDRNALASTPTIVPVRASSSLPMQQLVLQLFSRKLGNLHPLQSDPRR